MFVKNTSSASASFLICFCVMVLALNSAIWSVPRCVDKDPRGQYPTTNDSINFTIENLECEVHYELLLGDNVHYKNCNEYARGLAVEARKSLIARYDSFYLDLKDIQPNCFHSIYISPYFVSNKLICYREDAFIFYGGPLGNEGDWHLLTSKDRVFSNTSLNDLLNPSGAFIEVITTYVENCLLTKGASDVLEGNYSMNYDKIKDVGVTNVGLCYMFDKYEVGNGSEGTFEVLVPWNLIKDFIPQNGILFEMLKEKKLL